MLTIFSFETFSQTNPLWLRYTAISPNGKEIAFNYQGNIYKVGINGGKAIMLTSSNAYDKKPVWSPDGKKIAFASDRHGNFDIFIINSNGGIPIRLTYHSGNETPSSFSPDGKNILFSATIQDLSSNTAFPKAYISELYSVSINGGRIKQILSTPAEEAKYSKDMSKIIYQDSKSPESYWRKHHQSSAAKDIFIYDKKTGKHTKLTSFAGEDRLPIFSSDEKYIYYTSENNGKSFNIYKLEIENPKNITQITNFDTHPVRFLTKSQDDKILCFSYNGEIYIKKEGQKPKKINVQIFRDEDNNDEEYVSASSGASEMSVSPDGKEIAFILRGNVFVTSTDYSSTKLITNTPEQERSVSFSPDGKAILYASERDGSWNIYQTKKVNEDEPNFVNSTILREETLVKNANQNFQPHYSPDGKEIAFLENRTTLKVLNLKSKKTRTIVDGNYNYSYSDGDQDYEWSPDSKYFLIKYSPNMLFSNDIGLVKASGKEPPVNLTMSGYSDTNPKWVLGGKAMIWETDRNGYRSHGSWGSYSDIYIMFFTKDAYDKFRLTKEEYELQKELNKSSKKDTTKNKKDKVEQVKIEFADLQDRLMRVTINSSSISDAILSLDGSKLYYLTKFEKGYDLWVKNIRSNETKLATKLSGYSTALHLDKKGKNLFLFSGGRFLKIKTSGYSKKTISYKAEYLHNAHAERAYIFDHIWMQTYQKFYKKDMHGVDWKFYKNEYKKFLSHINNNYDFTEMLSELLGELNASHTGAYYMYRDKKGDRTAVLGALYDWNYDKDGLKIDEVVEKSPLWSAKIKITKGCIIEKINKHKVLKDKDFYQFLNHKKGKRTLLTIFNPKTSKRWTETIKPISRGKFNNLLYERWVKKRELETEKLSSGKIGYVHVKGMDSKSYRKVYSNLLGKIYHKDAVIVDTRYNGGGWLHDDLATLLSGIEYVNFVPRGHKFGYDPMTKWVKPSIVLVSEGNYSDAHAFPFVYTTLNIGKTVGMPVPGTMTAVWWETQIDRSIIFGIPEIGARDMNGNLLENQQLEPDYKVVNEYDIVIKNRDQQLEKAVEVLMKK